tara:strand:- start:1289 stop:1963 length:675 start_codon:yes stop_codon:yes gene_type:complete
MELAPYPKKIHSVSHALYRAVEELAGTDYAEDSDVLRRLKEFWKEHEYIGKPPANLDDLHKLVGVSGTPYIEMDTLPKKNKAVRHRYRIARYDTYTDKEAPRVWARCIYTHKKIERGEEYATPERIAKLERRIEDPWQAVRDSRPPRTVPEEQKPVPYRMKYNSAAIKTIVKETARKHPQLVENRTPDFKSESMNKVERIAILCGAAFIMAMVAFTVSVVKDLM